ncbi:hypothetical protein SDC9_89348 [bioreactor metagenome]|uniref:Uncharacterized protein n=1 Tax=bioreactor metagenome TaxID=1076179 RepID=A0A644ZNZ4_9ZZZZ
MRHTDKLLEKQKQNEREKKTEAENRWPDEVELLEERPALPSINTAGSVFDRRTAKRFGGINTAPSVFERGAVFHTRTGEE